MRKQKDERKKVKKQRLRRTKKIFLTSSFKEQHHWFGHVFRVFFRIKRPNREMHFNELEDIGVDQEKIKMLTKRFTFLVRLWLTIVLLGYFYMLYLFIQGDWYIAIISLSVLLIALANAFRFHFWRYQLQKKKLGCTLKEWASDVFKLGGK
ncbi:hypothetical protein [Facilibium subflavum]|uniref:hypothetical protein n=1 Tax=Facilibium subflavum TaxID=2219058 RepID=UPI000E64640D|nr:hypothetical protein [Facilibium subflavum]